MKLASWNEKISKQEFRTLGSIKNNTICDMVMARIVVDKITHGIFAYHKGIICHGKYINLPYRVELNQQQRRYRGWLKAMVIFGIITEEELQEHFIAVKEASVNHIELSELRSIVFDLEKIAVRVPKELADKIEVLRMKV